MTERDGAGPRTECFIYQLVPGQGWAYDEYHANVWPEVLRALRASGITDYSIYRRGDLVVSVWTRDPSAPPPDLPPEVQQKVTEWRQLMAPLFVAAADVDGQPLQAKRIFSLFP